MSKNRLEAFSDGVIAKGENHFAAVPTAAYGGVMFMTAVAYTLLQRAIPAHHGPESRLARALGPDWKGKVSRLERQMAD